MAVWLRGEDNGTWGCLGEQVSRLEAPPLLAHVAHEAEGPAPHPQSTSQHPASSRTEAVPETGGKRGKEQSWVWIQRTNGMRAQRHTRAL